MLGNCNLLCVGFGCNSSDLDCGNDSNRAMIALQQLQITCSMGLGARACAFSLATQQSSECSSLPSYTTRANDSSRETA